MNGRIQGRRIRIRLSPSVAASLLTGLNPFLVNVTGQSGYELNGLSSGASNVCALGHEQKCSRSAALPTKGELSKPVRLVAMGQKPPSDHRVGASARGLIRVTPPSAAPRSTASRLIARRER